MLAKVILAPYYLILWIRHRLYDRGWKKSAPAAVPTLCIGNITVGGTGKTPHTEMLLRLLRKNGDGRRIAVLSRGYRRRSKGFQIVDPAGDAAWYGDEPMQIARKFPSVTVAVDADRLEGCRLLAPQADLVLLDDAFQYRKLRPNLSIVLVDYNRPVHRDVLLPLGRLRDLPSRLAAADILIVTKCPSVLDEDERKEWAANLGLQQGQQLFFTTVAYGDLQPVFPEADRRYLHSHRLILLTGIANDAPMAGYLSDLFTIARRLRFPDHHSYSPADLRSICKVLREEPTAVVCTTEKDAQRLMGMEGVPQELKERLYQLPIEVHFLTPEEQERFVGAVSRG